MGQPGCRRISEQDGITVALGNRVFDFRFEAIEGGKTEKFEEAMTMRPVAGDILKSKSTGEFYKVKKVKERIILLEAEDTPNKVWLGNKECLEILYDRVERGEGEKCRFSCLISANRMQ